MRFRPWMPAIALLLAASCAADACVPLPAAATIVAALPTAATTPLATPAAARPSTAEPTRVPTRALPTPDPAFAEALADGLAPLYARDASARDLEQAASTLAREFYDASPLYAYASEGAMPLTFVAPIVTRGETRPYAPCVCWPSDGAAHCQCWPQDSLLGALLLNQPTQARVVTTSRTTEMGLISGPVGNSGEHSYLLLRLEGAAWSIVWHSAEDETRFRWLTDLGGGVRFLDAGLDCLEVRGRLPNDVPVARFFLEWRFSVWQEYVSVWQRRGDTYVRISGEIVESPMKALSEFMMALTRGDAGAAARRTSNQAVLGEAAAIGLDRLLPQHWAAVRDQLDDGALLLRELGNEAGVAPVYRVVLRKPHDLWLVAAVERLPTAAPPQ